MGVINSVGTSFPVAMGHGGPWGKQKLCVDKWVTAFLRWGNSEGYGVTFKANGISASLFLIHPTDVGSGLASWIIATPSQGSQGTKPDSSP